jgi:hypothetical protein
MSDVHTVLIIIQTLCRQICNVYAIALYKQAVQEPDYQGLEFE